MASYLTLKQAAHELGVHEQTLRTWERKGIIRMARLPDSGYRRVPTEEVERLRILMESAERPAEVRAEPPQRSESAMEEAHVLAAQVRSDLATAQPEIGFDEFLSRRRGRISSTSNERLARYVSEVIARLRPIEPAKIILFGSFATGSPTETSDLDLLVVTKSDRLPATYREKEAVYLEVVRLIRDIKQEISIDLIVHTQPMHARFIAMNSLFAREVLQKGVVLYESHHA